jgi:hypothetical protein
VVDEHAGQLVADGLVKKSGDDRAINAAGESAYDAIVSDGISGFIDEIDNERIYRLGG